MGSTNAPRTCSRGGAQTGAEIISVQTPELGLVAGKPFLRLAQFRVEAVQLLRQQTGNYLVCGLLDLVQNQPLSLREQVNPRSHVRNTFTGLAPDRVTVFGDVLLVREHFRGRGGRRFKFVWHPD